MRFYLHVAGVSQGPGESITSYNLDKLKDLLQASSDGKGEKAMPLEEKVVRSLERELEEAIAGVVLRSGLQKLPLLPTRHTMHLMAKAAVAVYEAVADDERKYPR